MTTATTARAASPHHLSGKLAAGRMSASDADTQQQTRRMLGARLLALALAVYLAQLVLGLVKYILDVILCHTSCLSCVQDHGCGYFDNTKACVPGGRLNPHRNYTDSGEPWSYYHGQCYVSTRVEFILVPAIICMLLATAAIFSLWNYWQFRWDQGYEDNYTHFDTEPSRNGVQSGHHHDEHTPLLIDNDPSSRPSKPQVPPGSTPIQGASQSRSRNANSTWTHGSPVHASFEEQYGSWCQRSTHIHIANTLSMYRTVKRMGIPDSHIILMLADDVACNPRNKRPAAVFDHPRKVTDLYGENVEVDYRGYEVTVESFIRLLTGRVAPETPRNKRLLTDDKSNVFIYMTGHGGEDFLKFQDAEEINSYDIADAFQQMWEKQRYHEILFVIDTCQANTMYSKFYSPNILSIGSSEKGENSYSHFHDFDLGVSVIDRFTYYNLEFFESVDMSSKQTLSDLIGTYTFEQIQSRPGVRKDLFARDISK
ncbi:glycosylphosphatidylinositol anchor biosynthesis, partial [Dipsacomyces acuminosporus]